jgi:pimeloyl-ACP methyl ester carboxylesterase
MVFRDDRLEHFAAHGAELPPGGSVGMVENAGAHIWHASYGSGPPIVLLHGGMGNAGNFAHQLPALLAGGWRPVLIDTRGHGRSTRDLRPFGYRLLGSDVLAVMDALGIARAPIIGWSDGACTGLVLAHDHPGRVAGVFFFACNVDPSGTRPFEMTP